MNNPYQYTEIDDSVNLSNTSEVKHSGPGIASTAMSAIGGLFFFALIFAAGIMSQKAGPSGIDANAPETLMLGFAILGSGFMQVVALILGIIGCCQKDRKKLFAIIGLSLSGCAILACIGLMTLGMMLA